MHYQSIASAGHMTAAVMVAVIDGDVTFDLSARHPVI
jgi:hypothetical protein